MFDRLNQLFAPAPTVVALVNRPDRKPIPAGNLAQRQFFTVHPLDDPGRLLLLADWRHQLVVTLPPPVTSLDLVGAQLRVTLSQFPSRQLLAFKGDQLALPGFDVADEEVLAP